jgi:hypothetical protein
VSNASNNDMLCGSSPLEYAKCNLMECEILTD